MSKHKRSDFGFFNSEDEGLKQADKNVANGDAVPLKKYGRSTSIDLPVEPTSSGLSFILNVDEGETAERDHDLHEDMEKMFDKQPRFSLDDLLSGSGESRPSDRGQEVAETPRTSDRVLEEYDIKSHRRASFPHIHVPLKSLHTHSSKNLIKLEEKVEEEEKEVKKKRKKKKKKKQKAPKKSRSNIFPSKSVLLQPSIPEVDNEEYTESDDSSDEDSPDESTKLLDETDSVPNGSMVNSKSVPSKLPQALSLTTDKSEKVGSPVDHGGDAKQIPTIITDPPSDDSLNHGLFYIGSDLHFKREGYPTSTDNFSRQPSEVISDAGVPSSFDDGPPTIVIDGGNDSPLVSTKYGRNVDEDIVDEKDKGKVKFMLGMEDTEEHEGQDEDEGDDWEPREDSNKEARLSPPPKSSPKMTRSESRHSHRHRKHHQKGSEHYGKQDLMNRRLKGSDVHLSDMASRVSLEGEDVNLTSYDQDDMASHRMENLQGFRKHKIGRKKHKTVSSVVYIGKSDKGSKKLPKPTKKFDHSPHEVFVELDELFTSDAHEIEWREKARWIKFEEDVEEGADRWGKPHVASLSFNSLLELRKGLENGSLMLDLEATDLVTIIHRTVESMVIHDQIPSEVKGQVMRTLLMKHKFVENESAVRALLTRTKSSMNLLGMDDRHQRDQLSLMKTLSSASFNTQSNTNLQQFEQNHNFSNNHLTVPHKANRSMSMPAAHHNVINREDIGQLEVAYKKVKEKEKKKKEPEHKAKLEFVKVDVDNNMTEDGVHIGLIPKEEIKEGKGDTRTSLMKRIPREAEACTVLVGCVDYLDKPAMAFVRLAEKQVLENLTEVPLPVRFVFVLLGPENSYMDYHEVGRSISTLMSNQHFHEVAYRAETRSEILHAINEFLNESIVLPPGDWDQKTLLPVMDMARKRAKIRRKKLKKQEEYEALLKKEEEDKIPMDPLKRTGRLFGGLINDIKRRYPHYSSDFKDAFNLQCVMALIFIFFACLAPCIAFGGLISEKTYRKMGVTETILSTSITNLVFALFSAQPLILYGATGPILVFEKHLYSFCKESHIDFMTWRVWIGFWVFVITLVVLAVEGSFIVRYFTRFTEEVFAILISLIFIFEVIHKLEEIYHDHPLGSKDFYCNSSEDDHSLFNTTTSLPDSFNYTVNVTFTTTATTKLSTGLLENVSSVYSEKLAGHYSEKESYSHGKGHYNKVMNEPNTALLSTILIFGTFLIAYFLRIFRNSKFLGRSARRALGDFGIFTAIVLMVLFDFICAGTYTQKLDIPIRFQHTDQSSSWIVNPLGKYDKPMKIWLMFMAIIPGFLIFLLLFLECQLTEMLFHKKEFKLHKGSGFHLDQFLIGLMTFVCALLGLPWMCAATVRSVAHMSALSVFSRTHAPGEKPKLLEVKDQRVTNIVMNLLIGTTLLWGDVLRAVPMAVLFGVFLYLGVSAISGVQLYKRIKLLFMPVKHHPGKSYVRRVKTLKMHMFTVIQLILVIIIWIVKSTMAAIVFPLLVFLMAPLRLKVLPKIFTHEELEVLDKEEEDSDDEEDEDPDFYQLAHMPI